MDTRPPNAPHRSSRREAGLVQRVRTALCREWAGATIPFVLIACSGGRDSIVLTHLLHFLAQTREMRIEIVHVDHGVRADSRDAARMVEAFGASIGIPVHVVQLDDDVLSRHPGAGAEEALRRERYRAFVDVTREIGADAVALGHHQQDQAETVLLHLARGSGLHGVSGMREVSAIQVPWWEETSTPYSLRLWRPLLAESASVIADWHRGHVLPVCEDATNADRAYRRNAIRHDILPGLESIFTGAVSNLARFADLAAEDDRLLERLAAERLPSMPVDVLERSVITEAEPSIQRRVVRRWILASEYDGELTSNRIDAVRELAARNRSGARLELGGGWSVNIDKGKLSLRR